MPYMHEQSLMDAYKRLYMLGGKSKQRAKEASDELDETVSGAVGGMDKAYRDKLMRDKAAAANLRKQLDERKAQEAADAEQMDQDVRYIKEGPEAYKEYQQVVQGNAIPTNPYKDELQKQALDKQRAASNIGGIYTPQGLQMADKEATLNAQDRLMLRSLIPAGLGGSSPIQNPPPDYLRIR